MSTESADLEGVGRCPVCGGEPAREMLQQADALFPTGVLRLVGCADCGLVFLNPRMTPAAIGRLENTSDVYEMDGVEADREIRARADLLRGLEAHVARKRRLLDVGCNRGLLLLAAKRLGWDVVGVEISPFAAKKAREAADAPVYSDLTHVPRSLTFDLIVAWHVLEHTTDPISLLTQIRSLLARRGVLALQVPSYDFVDEFRRQGRVSSLVCAVHNLYFTESTLSYVLRRVGFELRTVSNSSSDLMLTAFAALPQDEALAGPSRWRPCSWVERLRHIRYFR